MKPGTARSRAVEHVPGLSHARASGYRHERKGAGVGGPSDKWSGRVIGGAFGMAHAPHTAHIDSERISLRLTDWVGEKARAGPSIDKWFDG